MAISLRFIATSELGRWRQPGHWTPMSLACMCLRPRKLRATGQRSIRQAGKEEGLLCLLTLRYNGNMMNDTTWEKSTWH